MMCISHFRQGQSLLLFISLLIFLFSCSTTEKQKPKSEIAQRENPKISQEPKSEIAQKENPKISQKEETKPSNPKSLDEQPRNEGKTQETKIPVEDKTEKPVSSQIPSHDDVWIENSDEDRMLAVTLDQTMMNIASLFKSAQTTALVERQPMCIVFMKNEKDECQIGVFPLLSPPGTKPIKISREVAKKNGRSLAYQLPPEVMFSESFRYFWIDLSGDLDFFEEDQVFRVFDRPPKADIVILPKDTKNPRRGLIDLMKKDTQVHFYLLLAQEAKFSK